MKENRQTGLHHTFVVVVVVNKTPEEVLRVITIKHRNGTHTNDVVMQE
jgi:hypothetical protein